MDIYERQMKLEEESIGLGIARYKKELEKAVEGNREADLPPGLGLVHRMIDPMSTAMHLWIADVGGSRSVGKMKSTVMYLSQFDPDMLAVVTAREVINGISMQRRLQKVAMNITAILSDELEYEEMRTEAPGLYKTILKQTKTSSSYRHKRTVMLLAKRRIGLPSASLSVQERLKIGLLLIEKLKETTGFFQILNVRKSKTKTFKVMRAEPSVLHWLERAHDGCQVMNPVYLPMLVQPVDWTSPHSGGYLNPVASRVKLFKVSNSNYIEELCHSDLQRVYDAVNALQRTPWRINRAVYDVMSTVWDEGGSLGGLPPRENEPLPARHPIMDAVSDSVEKTERIRQWKRDASKIHEANARLESKRIRAGQKLNVAQRFLDEDQIFFPWTLDWRGRAYPVPGYVNPQADDSGKALLQFAEGKPLGDSGAFWLAVHIANLFGVDKCSFGDRVAWVEEHSDALMDSATFPLDGQRFWTKADKPYCALAACFEWLGYKLQGNGYVSHLPIAMDGSCNGLQNFSAMLLDAVGGKAVNLVPSSKPQDIYEEVAEAVRAKLMVEDNPLAALWHGKVTRPLVKRPVMTLPYGATKIGMRDQLLDHLKKVKEEGRTEELPDVEDPFKACMYLAGVIYDTIGEVVIAARQAMDWLQEAARVAARDGLPVRWTTPIGLPVLQMYHRTATKTVSVELGRIRHRLQMGVSSNDIDKRRQAQGIAPNFVHSLDASHMMLTTLRCVEDGIKSFAMIHDSYGVLAGDCERMYSHLRGAFVDMYSADVLGTFEAELREQMEEERQAELPPLPAIGELDLDGVYDSQYFFA